MHNQNLLNAAENILPLVKRYAMNSPTLEPSVDRLLPAFEQAIERAKLPPTQTIAQSLAGAVAARLNCIRSNNQEWLERWTQFLATLEKELPSGSGIDCGTKIDLDRSTGEKIVLHLSYRHMNENGMYDGWTDHAVTVTPTFRGFDLKISGRDRNQIKEYLSDVYHSALSENCEVQP